MKLWAISDVHVAHAGNLDALASISPRPSDWLLLAGDVGETLDHLHAALDVLGPKFARIVWTPGNHELYTTGRDGPGLRGEARYTALVEACRSRGVLTPEDPYPIWQGDGGPHVIAPTFLLYDYSFAPPGIAPEDAVEWAAEIRLRCADEQYLHPDPHPSKPAWCAARVALTERRLDALPPELPTVIVNHFPLRRDLVFLPRLPRFEIWCGTRRTESWHLRYRASVVVSGHLHVRTTRWRDGTRFEEVSLGYPRHWDPRKGADAYVREILPARHAQAADGDRFHR